MYEEYINYINTLPVYNNLYKQEIESLDPKCLLDLPVLEKNLVKKTFPKDWMSKELEEALEKQEIEFMTTSGTSGKQLQIIRKKHWWDEEYARAAMSHPLFNDVFEKKMNRAVLTTTICSNTFCSRTALSYENRIFGNILHLNVTPNPNHWSKDDIIRICNEINAFKPYNLDADPIYLAIFLKLKKQYDIDIKLHKPKFVSICYEYCPRSVCEFIKSYFDVPFLQYYASTELGFLYYRDMDDHRYHLFHEDLSVNFTEIDNERGLYELLITSFKNQYMPFVKYATGDVVRLTEGEVAKIKTQPNQVLLQNVCGRRSDLIYVDKKAITVADIDDSIYAITNKILVYKATVKGGVVLFDYTLINDNINLTDSEAFKLQERLCELFKTKNCSVKLSEHMSPSTSGKFKLIEVIE